jgi:hypothetical protein
VFAVPTTDPVLPDATEAWLASRRRARARRAAETRARQRRLRGRGGAAAVAAAMTVFAGGAVAHERVAAEPASETRAGGVLKRGSTGSAVLALQQRLGIGADGVFGRVTARAVRRFQRSNGLAVDGVVGPATAAKLGLADTAATVQAPAARGSTGAVLARIARCESGGDPTAISADGRYRGKYQFSRATWRMLGATGDPAMAPEAEQDRRALQLYRQAGTSPWPSCG